MPGEKFHVRLLPEEGSGAGDRVTVEVGLEGFLVHSLGGSCLRKYPLHHISRWSMRNGGGGGSDRLVLYTRSPVREGEPCCGQYLRPPCSIARYLDRPH